MPRKTTIEMGKKEGGGQVKKKGVWARSAKSFLSALCDLATQKPPPPPALTGRRGGSVELRSTPPKAEKGHLNPGFYRDLVQ